MQPKKFDRLVENIKKDKRLETLPLCALKDGEKKTFEIISGHHRIRAARAAGVEDIYVLVFDGKLTKDEIKSRQLAHNALEGDDDEQILNEIYQSIQGLKERLATGIMEDEINKKIDGFAIDELGVDLDYEVVNLAFLGKQKKRFDDVCKLIAADKTVCAVPLDQFAAFKEAIHKVRKIEDIRSIGAIVYKMCEIVKGHYKKPTG